MTFKNIQLNAYNEAGLHRTCSTPSDAKAYGFEDGRRLAPDP